VKLLLENWREFVKQEVEEFLPHGEVRAVEMIGSSALSPEERAKQDLEKYGFVQDDDERDIDIEVQIAGITREEAEEWAFSDEADELEFNYNYDVQLRIVENWRKFVSEDVDPKMKKYLKKHPYMEPDQLQGEAVEDVYTGNCGMFGIALAEEAQRRGVEASLVFAHNADTDQELAYGDYKLYHVALKIGNKYYDGRGEIQLKELVSFMWEKPEDMNVDAFNLKNLELMKDAIRRNTAWTQTCEYYREQASEFLDEMGYETDEVLSEGKKVKIFRAQPAFTKVIRTNDYITMSRKFAGDHAVTSAVYNDEPFHVVYAFVDENDIKEADNPGEYLYIGEPFEAKPSQMATPEGNLSFIRGRFNEESEFQTKMKKNLPAELDFLLNKGPHNKKEGPGVKNPKKPKFKSAPPGAEGG
jgi:hypothetical protein